MSRPCEFLAAANRGLAPSRPWQELPGESEGLQTTTELEVDSF
ncbi:hypothetical protein [Idiomarina abyssalis]